MFENKLSLYDRNKLLKDILIIGFFLAFAFFINKNIRISGLYMDDLYMWSCYGEQSFIEYVFPIASSRFRPVYWFLAWIQLSIIQNNITWIVTMNILFAVFIASILYFFTKKISKSSLFAFLISLLFLSSRFSYYNISQLLGFMEALALFFVLLILINLYNYLKHNKLKSYYKACIYYLLVCFVHERFMVILPIFFFVLICKKNKTIQAYFSAILSFVFVQIVRSFTIGSILPAGTGGTYVVETITLKSFLKNILAQILYIFGFNAGEEHLNGIRWQDTNIIIKHFVFIILISFIIYFILFILLSISSKNKKYINEDLCYSVFFLSFIASNIVASAVTIRVEMRWIYSSYMIALIYLAYIKSRISLYSKNIYKYFAFFIFLIYFISTIICDFYYHSKYDKIYIFPKQKIYNSLADLSYYKYKDKIFGNIIYIIGNKFEMSEFTAKTFFKVYKKSKNDKEVQIIHIDNIKDLPDIKNELVFVEDISHNEFVDITDTIKKLQVNPLYGYYWDNWLDQRASIDIMSGKNGKINFEFHYPNDLKGDEKILIKYDNIVKELEIKEAITKLSIETSANRIINFNFESNFFITDAKEQRGKDKLSILLNISRN